MCKYCKKETQEVAKMILQESIYVHYYSKLHQLIKIEIPTLSHLSLK